MLGEMKEELTIRRVHDNDLWIVKRITTEEVGKKELLSIKEEIKKAIKDNENQEMDISKKLEKKMEAIQKDLSLLRARLVVFEEHTKKFDTEVPEKEIEIPKEAEQKTVAG